MDCNNEIYIYIYRGIYICSGNSEWFHWVKKVIAIGIPKCYRNIYNPVTLLDANLYHFWHPKVIPEYTYISVARWDANRYHFFSQRNHSEWPEQHSWGAEVWQSSRDESRRRTILHINTVQWYHIISGLLRITDYKYYSYDTCAQRVEPMRKWSGSLTIWK